MIVDSKYIVSTLILISKPIVRFCIRHSLKLQDLVEIQKALFVETAEEELVARHGKATDSSISVMTGLHRRDISRFREGPVELNKTQDIVTKVIGQWQQDKRWIDSNGKPRSLEYGRENSDFSELVSLVSNDITPVAVLHELDRLGLAKIGSDSVVLTVDTFVPKGDPIGGFKILSEDVNDLLLAVEKNVLTECDPPNMHYRTEYDRINPSALPKIQQWFLKQGHDLHLKAREFLSKHDLDINPKPAGSEKPLRVSLSSFSYIDSSKES